MRKVFLDTVGLLAVWNRSDQWHMAAKTALQELLAGNAELYCSEPVLLECGNAASRSDLRDEVVEFRSNTEAAGFLLAPTVEEVEMAWQAYSRRDGGGAGVVDQISFVLMRREGITEAFTNDEHFRAAGYVALF